MNVGGLPSNTEIRKPVHKKILYAKFSVELSGERRKQFDDDIGRMIVTNEISSVSVNVKKGEQVKSIFVLQVELKKKNVQRKKYCAYIETVRTASIDCAEICG